MSTTRSIFTFLALTLVAGSNLFGMQSVTLAEAPVSAADYHVQHEAEVKRTASNTSCCMRACSFYQKNKCLVLTGLCGLGLLLGTAIHSPSTVPDSMEVSLQNFQSNRVTENPSTGFTAVLRGINARQAEAGISALEDQKLPISRKLRALITDVFEKAANEQQQEQRSALETKIQSARKLRESAQNKYLSLSDEKQKTQALEEFTQSDQQTNQLKGEMLKLLDSVFETAATSEQSQQRHLLEGQLNNLKALRDAAREKLDPDTQLRMRKLASSKREL
jgi:hypothetical protein